MINNNVILLTIALKVPIFFTIALIIVKFLVYKITGSLAIFSSFTDSSLDFVSSLITFVALKYSLKKENHKYNYGYHGVIDIATVIIAGFIIATSITVFYKSIINLINKTVIEYSDASVYAMSFSTLSSIVISLFLYYVYRKTQSILVRSEIAHYSSDIFTNAGVLISLLVGKFYTSYLIDPIIAIIMALISLKPATDILINAINNIMSKEVDEDIRQKIIEIATRDKTVMGYHKFKTRKSGERIFIQMDIELPSDITFKLAHDIVDKIQHDVENEIENSEIILHADPR